MCVCIYIYCVLVSIYTCGDIYTSVKRFLHIRCVYTQTHFYTYTNVNVLLCANISIRGLFHLCLVKAFNMRIYILISQLYVCGVISAGVDTTRMTLDWGLYLLASFPEIQRKTQEEIEAVTGTGCLLLLCFAFIIVLTHQHASFNLKHMLRSNGR